jgi:hypothetical protein
VKEFETCDLDKRVVVVLSRRHRKKCWIIQKHFVISNISAGSKTLCQGQHFAHELRLDWACLNLSSDRNCL